MITPSRSASRRPARRRCIRWRCRACVPSRFMALTRCSTMRLPLQPTGWPRLIAPPSTLSLAWSIWPAAPSSPRISRQNFSSFQAARQPSTCVAKASFNSQVSMSCKRQAVALQQFGRRQYRAEAHDARDRAPTTGCRGWRPSASARVGDRLFGSEDHPGGAVGDLRGIAGGDLAPGPLEHRL